MGTGCFYGVTEKLSSCRGVVVPHIVGTLHATKCAFQTGCVDFTFTKSVGDTKHPGRGLDGLRGVREGWEHGCLSASWCRDLGAR